MLITQTAAWQALVKHQAESASLSMVDMFSADPQRFNYFSLRVDDLLLDFSKQQITQKTLKLLCDLAVTSNLTQAVQDLFNGVAVNRTEGRPALHTELRNPQTARSEILQVLKQIADFVGYMQQSSYTDAIVLGIGGSDLGPRLVCEALTPYRITNLRLHFVANVDADTLMPLLKELNPQHTICIVNSKTFTTLETLANARLVQAWLGALAAQQMWAVTARPDAAVNFGIPLQQQFAFWDWVGGRYSVWSAVGLPIALVIGFDNFKRFLAGAHAMDQHFLSAPFEQNMPVLLGLLGIWNVNFKHYPSLAIVPYADGLQLLPAYLQQLEMESNGKSAANFGNFVDYQTAPVIWGGVGCNAQHAYMQMLHQGSQVVPVDFFVARKSIHGVTELQDLLVASCLGQSQALMTGRLDAEQHKVCPGNRPSNTIMCDMITPEIIGKLIALYEHKVFVQGVIWQIQSFDQWGVQLGKDLIHEILQRIRARNVDQVDSSTAGLLHYFLQD